MTKKYSSHKDHQLITERWRKFLAEGSEEVANEGLFGFNSPEGVFGTGAFAKSKDAQGTGFSRYSKGGYAGGNTIEKYGRRRFDRIVPVLANLLRKATPELLTLLKSTLHRDYAAFTHYRRHIDKKARAGQKKPSDAERAPRGGPAKREADKLDGIYDDMTRARDKFILKLNKIEKDLFGSSTELTTRLDHELLLRAALDAIDAKPLEYDTDDSPVWGEKPPESSELAKDVDWDK